MTTKIRDRIATAKAAALVDPQMLDNVRATFSNLLLTLLEKREMDLEDFLSNTVELRQHSAGLVVGRTIVNILAASGLTCTVVNDKIKIADYGKSPDTILPSYMCDSSVQFSNYFINLQRGSGKPVRALALPMLAETGHAPEQYRDVFVKLGIWMRRNDRDDDFVNAVLYRSIETLDSLFENHAARTVAIFPIVVLGEQGARPRVHLINGRVDMLSTMQSAFKHDSYNANESEADANADHDLQVFQFSRSSKGSGSAISVTSEGLYHRSQIDNIEAVDQAIADFLPTFQQIGAHFQGDLNRYSRKAAYSILDTLVNAQTVKTPSGFVNALGSLQ